MKKIIAVLGLLAMAAGITACASKHKLALSEYSAGDFDMSGDIVLQTEHEIYGSDAPEVYYTITNNTDEEYVYGVQYAVEVLQENRWYQVPFPPGQAWIAIGIVLKPNETNTASFKFADLKYEMTDGTYRLIKEISDKRYFTVFQVGDSPITAETPLGYKALEKLPTDYSSEDAALNGDVILALGGVQNAEKLTDFVSKAALGIPAMVRLVRYTEEGDPIIYDCVYNKNETGNYLFRQDSSRDKFGGQNTGIIEATYSFLITDGGGLLLSNCASWGFMETYSAAASAGLVYGNELGDMSELIALVEKMAADRLLWNNTRYRVFSPDSRQNVMLYGGLSYGYEGHTSSENRHVSDPAGIATEIVNVLWLEDNAFVLICQTNDGRYYYSVVGTSKNLSGYGTGYTMTDGTFEITP